MSRSVLFLVVIFNGLELIAQDQVYEKLFTQQLQGKEYRFSYADIIGHQFHESQVYQAGTLLFDGVDYQEILLNYDIYNDLVVTTLLQNGITQNIVVDNLRLERFRIGQENFINLTDSVMARTPGIYKLVFEKNDVQLLAKIQKHVVGNNRPGERLKKFSTRHLYILSIGDESFIITHKKDLLQAFRGNPEMLSAVQQAKIKFRKKAPDEAALIEVLEEL